jgi:hypothetical protein
MTLQEIVLLAALLGQTGALVWWGATMNSAVKQHERQLADHEERLRAGAL